MKNVNFQHYMPMQAKRRKPLWWFKLLLFSACMYAAYYVAIKPEIFNAGYDTTGGNAPGRLLNYPDEEIDKMNSGDLITSAVDGNDKLVRKLLEKIPVDSKDSEGRTALIGAAYHGNDAICASLLDAGARLDTADKKGFTALDYAAARGLVNTVKLLLEKSGSRDNKHHVEYAMLMQASFASMPELLPKNGNQLSTVNRISVEGKSPLHVAASIGSTDITGWLLKHGANIRLKLANGQTALHWAARNNHPAVISLLLNKQALINAQDEDGNTPLMLATMSKSKEAVLLLLSKNAYKKLKNKKGETAEAIANGRKYTEIVSLLR